MKILIVTDAWHPQVNGVVRTLDEVGKQLINQGHNVRFLTPLEFRTFAVPTYKEIKLPWNIWKVSSIIKDFNPDAIHIATEGTLGIAARWYCTRHKIEFTSSYHTKFPEYIKLRFPFIPLWLSYKFMRWVHSWSKTILVTTESMKQELIEHKFKAPIVVWSRGVDYEIFNPSRRFNSVHQNENRPPVKTLLYVGRVSIEKNLEAFLKLEMPNTIKVIVGDGPARKKMEDQYPYTAFLGYKDGIELAMEIANADVFVFPSKTDTFGIVMIEAAACGTPVAAYPVTGPIDFVKDGINGSLNENLEQAIKTALTIDRKCCYEYTKANYSWEYCAKIFFDTLALIHK
ncbi:MAG: glycosyltransferase family 1 protein [Thaumarchaeota archaeon]|nr:glycosyltransferase family 1 protein [Nitrososphaerota archaeon]